MVKYALILIVILINAFGYMYSMDFPWGKGEIAQEELSEASQKLSQVFSDRLKSLFKVIYTAYKKGNFGYKISSNDRKEIAKYLREGADANGFIMYDATRIELGGSVTHYEERIPFLVVAVRMKDLQLINLLLESKANPNSPTSEGGTPLIEGLLNMRVPPTIKDHEKIILLLLKYGADPNIQDNRGRRALIVAIDDKDKEVVRILLAAGADPNIVNIKSETPLMLAVKNGDIALIRLLLENRANPNLPNAVFNAKTVAQERGDQSIIDLLNAKVERIP